MTKEKKVIVDARADDEGDITAVKFEGNSRFTSAEKAFELAKRGEIENAHAVERRGAKPHIRTNPDSRKSNNLDEMAGDHKP